MSARLRNPFAHAGPGRTFMLADWVTVSGTSAVTSITQAAEGWLDLSEFADATFYIDVAQVTNPTAGTTAGLVVLVIETAPTPDESLFTNQPVAGPLPLAAGTAPIIAKTAGDGAVPLSRYVRWRAYATAAAAWGATFRVRVVGNRSSYFAPTQFPGCALWLRADRGITFSGTAVSAWADQSGSNDPHKNATVQSSSPSITVVDSTYGCTTMSFAAAGTPTAYLATGAWTTALAQPHTWIVVGHRSSTSNTNFAFDGIGSGAGAFITATNSPYGTVQVSGGSTLTSNIGCPWTSKSAVLVEFNTTNTNIYYNDFTNAVGSGNGGSLSFDGATLAGHSIGFGGGSTWGNSASPGTLAEIIAFSGLLSGAQKACLKRYLNNRYALSIA